MHHFEFELKTGGRIQLWGQGWDPDIHTKAIVCWIHGLGEHSGRCHHVAEAFNRAGYAWIAFDLRGHGRSGGRRGHATSYAVLMADIDAFLAEVGARYPDLPRFLYGHSLGGNLLLHYVLKYKPHLAGAIASAPLLRLAFDPPPWKNALIHFLQAAHFEIPLSSGLEPEALSRDSSVVRHYRNDPLVHDRITPALAAGMLHAGRWNLKHAAEFPLSLLLMHGEADRITSVEASIEFAAQLRHRGTLKIWNELYHELHNEPEQRQVFDFVVDWMGRRLPVRS